MHKGKRESQKLPMPVVGWREWISLPLLDVERIKAKIDTGARSSSLHAFDIEEFTRGSQTWVRFSVHPFQHSKSDTRICEAPLMEYREIRSSSGHISLRPVINTFLSLGEYRWPMELTLSSRDEMGFRLLLGRQAMRDRFVVHSGASFLISK